MVDIFLRLYFSSDARIGPGKIRLLELVEETGSISVAAKRLDGMSYRRAWLLLRSLNTMFGRPVLETRSGGKNGGGAQVTEFGRELIRRFRSFEYSLSERAAAEFADLQGLLSADHQSETQA